MQDCARVAADGRGGGDSDGHRDGGMDASSRGVHSCIVPFSRPATCCCTPKDRGSMHRVLLLVFVTVRISKEGLVR